MNSCLIDWKHCHTCLCILFHQVCLRTLSVSALWAGPGAPDEPSQVSYIMTVWMQLNTFFSFYPDSQGQQSLSPTSACNQSESHSEYLPLPWLRSAFFICCHIYHVVRGECLVYVLFSPLSLGSLDFIRLCLHCRCLHVGTDVMTYEEKQLRLCWCVCVCLHLSDRHVLVKVCFRWGCVCLSIVYGGGTFKVEPVYLL